MAIHHPTPPLCGGERPRLAARHYSSLEQCSGGPVTQAIRAMRANVPARNIRDQIISARNVYAAIPYAIRGLSRTEVEDLVGSLIDLLDAMDGDTDREQDSGDEPELENEHGGDVQDEPHDAEHDERDAAQEWSGDGEHIFTVGGLCS